MGRKEVAKDRKGSGKEEEEEEEEEEEKKRKKRKRLCGDGRPRPSMPSNARLGFFCGGRKPCGPPLPSHSSKKGCPMFRVLCETWDSTVPSLWGSCLHARKNRARVVGI
jgi:hypothetical protein